MGKGGFTLVELSIVLVIIGLLIGGILAAQSMISTAKINATVRQIGQFDAGVMSFKTKYNALPGDAAVFGGNGDGMIDLGNAAAWPAGIGVFADDIANFFNNLYPEKFAISGFWVGGAQAAVINGNVPESKLGNNGAFFIASAISTDGWLADETLRQNYYVILGGTQAHSTVMGGYFLQETTASNSAVRPIDLLALDKKMDDGIANSGNVLSGGIPNHVAGVGGITSTPGASLCSSGANYDLTRDSHECTPLIRICGSVGDPQ